jgi:hypothetical protein
VAIGDTVRSFREILDGKHDDLPESAFLLKGAIEDVVEAAGKGSNRRQAEDSGGDDANAAGENETSETVAEES